MRPLAVVFVETVIESFADDARSLGLSTTAAASADPAISLEVAPAHAEPAELVKPAELAEPAEPVEEDAA